MAKDISKFRDFDIANYLTSEEIMAEYLNQELAEGDPHYIQLAISNIARARNMTALSEKAGLSRAGLYKALAPDSRPEYETIQKIISALDMRLMVVPNSKAPHAGRASATRRGSADARTRPAA